MIKCGDDDDSSKQYSISIYRNLYPQKDYGLSSSFLLLFYWNTEKFNQQKIDFLINNVENRQELFAAHQTTWMDYQKYDSNKCFW